MDYKILKEIHDEIESAKARYPQWPTDAIHAAAKASEEAGELMQAANDHCYPDNNHHGKDTVSRMRKEAVQTAAMAYRFLENLKMYEAPRSDTQIASARLASSLDDDLK